MRKLLLTIIISSLSALANAGALPLAQTMASSLNVRAEPEGSVLVSLPRHTIVGVMETQGDWTRIMYFPATEPAPAQHGWVSSSYLKAIDNQNHPRPTVAKDSVGAVTPN